MKLFTDKALENQIFDHISFGIVPVGETYEMTIWIINDDSPKRTGQLRQLHFEVHCLDPETEALIKDEEVKIIEAPKEMNPMEVAPLTMSWTPNVTLEQGLTAKLTIAGQKIIG